MTADGAGDSRGTDSDSHRRQSPWARRFFRCQRRFVQARVTELRVAGRVPPLCIWLRQLDDVTQGETATSAGTWDPTLLCSQPEHLGMGSEDHGLSAGIRHRERSAAAGYIIAVTLMLMLGFVAVKGTESRSGVADSSHDGVSELRRLLARPGTSPRQLDFVMRAVAILTVVVLSVIGVGASTMSSLSGNIAASRYLLSRSTRSCAGAAWRSLRGLFPARAISLPGLH